LSWISRCLLLWRLLLRGEGREGKGMAGKGGRKRYKGKGKETEGRRGGVQ